MNCSLCFFPIQHHMRLSCVRRLMQLNKILYLCLLFMLLWITYKTPNQKLKKIENHFKTCEKLIFLAQIIQSSHLFSTLYLIIN